MNESPTMIPSAEDVAALLAIRSNISRFLADAASTLDGAEVLLLDVAPQDHGGAAPFFSQATIETLDINPASGATWIADLCSQNDRVIPDSRFDVIICTEVLEHTRQPFNAVAELFRMLKPGGTLLVSTPFNFRIHGPLPDCWRFTVHGLRELFDRFESVHIDELPTPGRALMPLQYTLSARKF